MVGMKFHKIVFIYIIVQLFCCPFVWCADTPSEPVDPQEVQKVKDQWNAEYEAWADERRANYSPRWEGQFDDITLRANMLVEENGRLAREQEALVQEWQKVKAELDEQKNANQVLETEISRKKYLMDNKRWKQEADAELKALQQQADQRNKELEGYDRQLSSLDKKIQLGKLKLGSLGVDYTAIDQRLKALEDVEGMRARLNEADDRQKVLTSQLERLKASGPIDPAVVALKEEVDALKLKIAEAQKGGAKEKITPQSELAALTGQKEMLQKEIERLKAAVDKIEHAQDMGIANQRVKALVEEMSAIDLQNNDLKEEMDVLKENIAILKQQVKKLEYQADSINAMKGNMGQMEQLKNPFN
jgi:chromosome segregation ATPase